ncbi:CatA-like O-acetyltransferase [Winogradskyella sp. PE311]|uniref:CatA-like O-acetyltransferase n=1 Tax=Winogradskyella sp. PE311 TaxID=3366943 RepID=UPI0039804D7A
MRKLDTHTWNRKQIFDHFRQLIDPYFGVVIPFDVTKAYRFAKEQNVSFFVRYLHDCMKAVNTIENFRLRIINDDVVDYETIHASATIMRDDKTFGFSFIKFNEDFQIFNKNFEIEKERIQNSNELFPPVYSEDCIHCSALPWFTFTSQKEPSSGRQASVPEIAFSKFTNQNEKLIMNVSVHVNHALVDGYHVGLFSEKFQFYLNT